jgi:hypothetical protein
MKLKSMKWTDKGYKVAVVQTEDSENEVIFYMKFVKPEAMAILREIATAYQEILGIENSMEGFTIRPEGKDKPRAIVFEGEAISNDIGYKIKTYPIPIEKQQLDDIVDRLSDIGKKILKTNDLIGWIEQLELFISDNFSKLILTETQQLELFAYGN